MDLQNSCMLLRQTFVLQGLFQECHSRDTRYELSELFLQAYSVVDDDGVIGLGRDIVILHICHKLALQVPTTVFHEMSVPRLPTMVDFIPTKYQVAHHG